MLDIFKHAHSGLRYPILLFIIIAIFIALTNKNDKDFSKRSVALAALILMHIQVLIGLVLYFISPKVQFISGMMKDLSLRFYAVEHILAMLIAAIIITIGFSKAKRVGQKPIASYYIFALVLILVSIPWPFRIPGTGWF